MEPYSTVYYRLIYLTAIDLYKNVQKLSLKFSLFEMLKFIINYY